MAKKIDEKKLEKATEKDPNKMTKAETEAWLLNRSQHPIATD